MTEERNLVEDLDPCPDEQILRSFAEERQMDPLIAGTVEAHVEFCTSCRRKVSEFRLASVNPEEFVESLAKRLKERQDTLAELSARGNVPGSIWRTVPQAEDDLYGPMVVVVEKLDNSPRGLVRVAEVSEAIDQALDTDLLLSPQESGLSFPCMVRSGNVFKTEFRYLKTFAGQLPPMLVRRIVSFCNSSGSFDDNVPLSQYVFFKDTKGITFMQRRGVTSGLPVTTDDDPRLSNLKFTRSNCYHLHLIEYDDAMSFDFHEGYDDGESDDGIDIDLPEELGEKDDD